MAVITSLAELEAAYAKAPAWDPGEVYTGLLFEGACLHVSLCRGIPTPDAFDRETFQVTDSVSSHSDKAYYLQCTVKFDSRLSRIVHKSGQRSLHSLIYELKTGNIPPKLRSGEEIHHVNVCSIHNKATNLVLAASGVHRQFHKDHLRPLADFNIPKDLFLLVVYKGALHNDHCLNAAWFKRRGLMRDSAPKMAEICLAIDANGSTRGQIAKALGVQNDGIETLKTRLANLRRRDILILTPDGLYLINPELK